jgi:hypothetical protein
MFLKTSRYANVSLSQITLPDGTQTAAVRLRTVPVTSGDLTPVTSNDRLDVMAYRSFGDATRYWHIADANSALDSNRLFDQWLEDDQNAPPLGVAVPES